MRWAGASYEHVVVLGVAVGELRVESTPQQFTHHEVLARVPRRDAPSWRFPLGRDSEVGAYWAFVGHAVRFKT